MRLKNRASTYTLKEAGVCFLMHSMYTAMIGASQVLPKIALFNNDSLSGVSQYAVLQWLCRPCAVH